MKTLIINLDRSVERMENMQRLARDLSLDFERVPAVDGELVDPATRKLHEETAKFTPSNGELGCFLSHQECWRRIAEGTDDAVLILEDDIVSLTANREVLPQAYSLARRVDLVRLEGHWAKVWAEKRGIPLSESHQALKLMSGAIGLGAYIVSKAAARKLLEMHSHYRRPIDLALYANLNDELDIRIVLPTPFAQGYLVGMVDGAYASTISARGEPSGIKSGSSLARRWERIRRFWSGQRRFAQM